LRKFAVAGLVAVAITVATSLVVSSNNQPEYKTAAVCKMCHKLTHADIVNGYEMTGHAKAMQKADAEGAIVADFSSNPMFSKDKVAYVLGRGVREQAYLDANYQVLPAKWDVKAKKWKPIQAVDGATQCIGCHTTGFDVATKKYAEMGVGCEACHGPGSAHVADTKTGILNPKKLDQSRIDMICGQCHSKGKDPSGKFPYAVGFKPGDDLTKFLIDSKPTMPGSNQQYSEHITSKHATEKVGCTVCHDVHNVTLAKAIADGKPTGGLVHQLKQPINDQCLSCHAPTIVDMKTHAPNAAADATCASCHMEGGVHTFKKANKE
jgi:hypothetical protein